MAIVDFTRLLNQLLQGQEKAFAEFDDYSPKDFSAEELECCNNAIAAISVKDPNYKHALTLEAYLHAKVLRKRNLPLAIKLYNIAIQLGDSNAMVQLAHMHRGGKGTKKDLKAAFSLFEQAAQFDNQEAIYYLGRMYIESLNFEKAIYCFERGIELEDSNCMNSRALMHKKGQGGEPNLKAAILLYQRAIQLGNRLAMYNLALVYSYGNDKGEGVDYSAAMALLDQLIKLGDGDAKKERALLIKRIESSSAQAMNEEALVYIRKGGEENLKEAINLLQPAIQLGNAEAMKLQALICIRKGGEENYKEAINLLESAIQLGNPDAMRERALMHRKGQGGKTNFKEAIKLLDRAVQLGNAAAMTSRAIMHISGEGDKKNYLEAIRLTEKAIQLSNVRALSVRAYIHMQGINQQRKPNWSAAIELLEKGIELGDYYAMNDRAAMYMKGRGGKTDYTAANQLFERAMDLGYKIASINRVKMHQDNLGQKLSPERLAFAQKEIILHYLAINKENEAQKTYNQTKNEPLFHEELFKVLEQLPQNITQAQQLINFLAKQDKNSTAFETLNYKMLCAQPSDESINIQPVLIRSEKKELFALIKTFKEDRQIELITLALDKTSALGLRFWKEEDWLSKCGLDKGILKEMIDYRAQLIEPLGGLKQQDSETDELKVPYPTFFSLKLPGIMHHQVPLPQFNEEIETHLLTDPTINQTFRS